MTRGRSSRCREYEMFHLSHQFADIGNEGNSWQVRGGGTLTPHCNDPGAERERFLRESLTDRTEAEYADCAALHRCEGRQRPLLCVVNPDVRQAFRVGKDCCQREFCNRC